MGSTVSDFEPTHEITLTDRRDHTRRTFPVQLVDGAAYTREEWDADTAASWEYDGNQWTFQGEATPAVYLSVSVRKLGLGPTGRTGDPTKPRSFRATDAEWSRWTALAEARGVSMGDLIRSALGALS